MNSPGFDELQTIVLNAARELGVDVDVDNRAACSSIAKRLNKSHPKVAGKIWTGDRVWYFWSSYLSKRHTNLHAYSPDRREVYADDYETEVGAFLGDMPAHIRKAFDGLDDDEKLEFVSKRFVVRAEP